ncbi:phage tail protein [Salmonella enterica]|nr:phage tail protein [Salmonella enterica]
MIIGFGNNVVSSLAADITASQTTIQVMPGAGEMFAKLLTSDFVNTSNPLKVYSKITLTDAKETVFEVCHLTAVNNDMLTVIRGQEGTTAKGWSLNDVIANFATRGSENQFVQIEELQSGHYVAGVAGGTENNLTLELPATYFVNGGVDWTLRTPLVVIPALNNTGASTLQLTMGGRVLGIFPLYKGNKAELSANDIIKDAPVLCVLDNTKTYFSVLNPLEIYLGSRYLQKGQNLADVPDKALARQSLQLGNSATLNVGTTPDTVAAGDDSRITGAMQKDQNGADIPDKPKFIQNLGLKETVERATNAVQKNGDEMTGSLTLRSDDRMYFVIANADGSVRAFIYKDKGGDGIRINNGADGGGEFVLNKDGGFYVPSHLHIGNAWIANDGNIFGTRWDSSGAWLWEAIVGQLNTRSTIDYVNQTFVRDVRAGNVESARVWHAYGYNDQAPYVITGVINGNTDDLIDSLTRRPLQKNINGIWYNIDFI